MGRMADEQETERGRANGHTRRDDTIGPIARRGLLTGAGILLAGAAVSAHFFPLQAPEEGIESRPAPEEKAPETLPVFIVEDFAGEDGDAVAARDLPRLVDDVVVAEGTLGQRRERRPHLLEGHHVAAPGREPVAETSAVAGPDAVDVEGGDAQHCSRVCRARHPPVTRPRPPPARRPPG